ncbi:serine phosphatase RsbU (regulator of sigma subunit)/DNA-binding CsgD family transcriptional regulator [Kineococcus radiotolerans]|uniref:Serine phosphatase RsbU (Regulator of sigma subunit)/DNA-binding CsgD family transcriptional regulator n=1 Tax=Kineococcus radiotolerans TaxID=131568 RepID=A0A7W4XZI4_KINRA|nr:serine phosphatase RsbU (regulator of sigma subunit)/DNA-binding CsgD family transcriptional regulator [Kineococcus radiotolerans]
MEGEAGIGKTTLVAALERTTGYGPIRVLRCTGVEVGPSGFSGLHELLHPLLQDVDTLPARQRSALLTAFGCEEGPAPDRLLLGLAVLGLLEEAAASQPLLVIVEDLQWLDAASADVIAFIARRLTPSPVLLLATVRSCTARATPWRAAPWQRLELGPLRPADASALLDATAAGLRPATRTRVLHEAGGNPLALRELGSALSGATHTPSPTQTLPTTQRLEQAFLTEVQQLPAATRRLLLLAAAEGGEVPLSRLAAASGAPAQAVADLDPAERADLVSISQGQVRFRHPLVRSAVYGGAALPERAEAHRSLADVSDDPSRAVWHRASGTHVADEELAAALEATAHRAVRRGAPEEAFAALERAASLSPQVPDRARRLASAAEVARRAGLAAEAVRALEAATPLAQDPAVQDPAVITRLAITRGVLAAVHSSGGRSPGDLVAALVQLAADLAGPEGTSAAPERLHILMRAAVQAATFGLEHQALRDIEHALQALDVAGGHPLRDVALAVLDPARHGHRVRGRFPSLVRYALDQHSDVIIRIATTADFVHDLFGAQEAWEHAVRAFHTAGAVGDEAHALLGRGSVRLLTGRIDDAVADLQLGLRMALDADHLRQAGYGEAALARAYALRGEHAQALAACARSVQLCGSEAIAITIAAQRWATGLVALAEQRPSDAWEQLQGVAVHPPTAALALGDLAEAAVRAGKAPAAAALVEDAERFALATGAVHLQSLAHRARALLRADAGDTVGALTSFKAADEAAADNATPLELARTRLLYGEWLRRQRRIIDAREPLAAALTSFAAVGARELAQRAAAELRAAGVVPPGTARDGRDGRDGRDDPATLLTAQELQIAQLAASGMTNKEIADKIYLSHRTVAAHLYKAFPKLGITHRTQLRDAITTPRAAPRDTPPASPRDPAPVTSQVLPPAVAQDHAQVTSQESGPAGTRLPAPRQAASGDGQLSTNMSAPRPRLLTRYAEAVASAVSADEVAAAAAHQLVTELEPTLVSVVLRSPRPRVVRHWSVRGGGLDVDAHGWRTASLTHESPSLDPARCGRGDFHEDLSAFTTQCTLVQGVVRSAGLHALVDLPLTISGRVIGFLVIGWDAEQQLPPQLRRTLEEFAATCAQALERCLAAARGRSLLRSLQDVVPRALTSTPYMQLAARSQAAGIGHDVAGGVGHEVGGDWYDAFADDGSTILIIGDVTGHGPAVAAAAASLRGVLASHALEQDSPAQALTRLDRAVERLALPAGATAVVLQASATPTGAHLLRWSNAGHPPPLVLLPEGQVEELRSAPELPVGVDPHTDRHDHEREVPPGTTVIMFTDGLLETRSQDLDTGLHRLRADLTGEGGIAPQVLVDRLLERVAGETSDDDVTVLVAQLAPITASSLEPALAAVPSTTSVPAGDAAVLAPPLSHATPT